MPGMRRTITDEAAAVFPRHRGSHALAIRSLSDSAAASLAKRKGRPALQKLRTLSPEAAQMLSTHPNIAMPKNLKQ